MQDELTIVKYSMEVLRWFRYWTLWMSRRYTVTLGHGITVYNDMFDHMDHIMRDIAKKKTPWKEGLYFAVKLGRQKVSKYFTEVTSTTGMLIISTLMLDRFRKVQLFRNWDKGTDIHPADGTLYTAQYNEVFLKYVENEYWAKHRCLLVIKCKSVPNNNLFSSATASGSSQSYFDQYDLSSDVGEQITPNNVAEMTSGRSDRIAHLLTVVRLYLNSPLESPKNWGLINPSLNDYLSNWVEISSSFWIPAITDWWWQQEETHSVYANHSHVARNIFTSILHGVRVEDSVSLGRDVISWRLSKTTSKTLREDVVVRQLALAIIGILGGDDPASDMINTENDSKLKREAEERKIHSIAKVYDVLEM